MNPQIFFSLIFTSFISISYAKYNEVYKLYTPEESDFIPLNEDYFSMCGKMNPFKNDIDFVKNGLSGIFWREAIKIDPKMASRCLSHIKDIESKFREASVPAFKCKFEMFHTAFFGADFLLVLIFWC